MSARPDDVAQVILRALLAWPLLGTIAGVVLRTVDEGPARVVAFAVGAGFGAALAVTGAELARLALAGRRPRLGHVAGLLALALLAPALLLGGEFTALLLEKGSSAKATQALLAEHRADPGALLDLDASLSVVLVGAALLVGRARGAPLRAQAAAGAWLVLVGVALRLALGRLEAIELRWLLLVEVGLATLAPFQVALADLAVRGGRRLLVGQARPARVAGVLGLTLAPAGVAALWSLALERVSVGAPDLLLLGHLEAAWAGGLVLAALVALAVAYRRGASRRALLLAVAVGTGLPTALLGRESPRLGLAFVGVALATALLLPAAALLVRRTKAAARALVPRRAPGRPRLALALALLLAVGEGAAAGRRTAGWSVRARAGRALGLDPVALLRRADGAVERVKAERDVAGWTATLFRLGLARESFDALDGVRRAAAARGDRDSIIRIARSRVPGSGDDARVRAWLAPLAAVDDLDALELLFLWARDDVERERAVARLLELGRRRDDDAGCAALAFVWEERPGRRAEVEELVVALGRGRAARLIVRERGVVLPGRPLLRCAAASYREAAPLEISEARQLHEVLRLDPSLLELDDLERLAVTYERAVELLSLSPGWTLPLAALDLRPLAPRGPALEAAARGQWVAAWQASTAALLVDPGDVDALRARAHVLLAVARGDLAPPPGPLRPVTGAPFALPALALVLAHEALEHLGLPGDAPAALDRALCGLHLQLGGADDALPQVWAEAAPHFAEGDRAAEVQARALALQAAAARASLVQPAERAAARAYLASELEAAGSTHDAVVQARRRAAAALRAAR